MRKLWIGLLAFAPLAFAQTQAFTYTYSGLPLPIYPNNWNVWSYANILVPKSIAVSSVTASVQVQYNGVGDLNVYLWSPAGTRTKLLERNCGGLTNIDTTFDDSASTMYRDFCPAEAGRGPFKGNEPLANSRNENAFGYWQLGVENNGSGNTGTLTGFSITINGTITGPPVIGPNTVVSTSSFKNGTVAPGDQVVVFGVNLGPLNGVRADETKVLPTTLGQTTVKFDATAAPLNYASNNFVVAQVPTTLTPGTTTKIQVMSSSGTSSTISLSVVPAKPGIFTYEAGGEGQAKVLNQDFSVNGDGSINGSDKPAAPGSVIQVFATGLGPLDPPIPQGTPAPADPLSIATLPVTATIAGMPATVMYKGAAPGLIGVYQVNVVVPTDAPHGTVRLVLTSNGNHSQDGATIEIE